MRRIPPLAAVRVFEAAARHGNFTRAAAELGMTQAAVSYQIKLLEERLGAPLFVRQGRGLTLSEHGSRIAPEVTRAFDSLDGAFGSIRDHAEGVLTISAPASFAANWLAGRLGGFQLTRPGLAVRLLAEDRMIDFGAGEADVAVRTGAPPWAGLSHTFLMRMVFAPFASPALIAAHPPVHAAADLLAMPRLADEQWWPVWFRAAGVAVADEQPVGGVRFDSQVLVGNAALRGHGIGLLTPLFWEPQIASGQLVRISPVIGEWCNFWLVHPEGRRNAPKIKAFKEWLLAEIVRAAGDDPDGVLVPPAVA